jgi:hypothetical protein
MKKLEVLTKEQEDLIPIVRQEWLDLFFKNKGNLNKKLFEAQIDWLYKRLNYKKPFIWYCDSPLMVQIIINIIKNTPQTNALIRENNNIGANIRDNIGANIRANIGDNIRDNIGDNIWDNIGDNISANIRANIRDNKLVYEPVSCYCNVSDFGWVAFYDYFKRLNYFKFDWTDFENFQKLITSGVYDFVAFKDIVFVSSCPIEVSQDNNNRLHNTSGASVMFKDGYSVYAIHGRILPSWIWEQKEIITKEKFLSEKNAEIRGGIYSVLGDKKIMELLGAIEIDKKIIQHRNDEVEIIKLIKTKESFPEIDNNPFAWVKFICPSTGSDYLIPCEPKFTNAKEAAASLSIFKTEEYSFDYRT